MIGSFEGMRKLNRLAVLHAIRTHGPVARVEIARMTGLTRPTVSDIVEELLREEWIRALPPVSTRPGRRPILLEFCPQARLVIGIEAAVDRVRAALVDLAGKVQTAVEASFRSPTPERLVTLIGSLVDQLCSQAGGARLMGVGLGLHGLVDTASGTSRFAPHFGWRDVPIRALLADRLDLSVCVDNDVRAMALGEAMFGAGRSAVSLVYVYVGSGIGAGIVFGGKVYHGLSEGAGEIGHTFVAPGRRCSCGNDGCLETVAAVDAVLQRYRDLTPGSPLPSLDGLLDAARAGDPAARQVLTEAGRYLGQAVGNLVNLLNPEVVVLGGPLAAAGDLILLPVTETAHSIALQGLSAGLRIVPVSSGPDAGVIGAAALVIDKVLGGEIE